MRVKWSSVIVASVVLAVTVASAFADSGANHQVLQTRPIKLGTSGGNVNDISHAFCCSGTLGSLVTDGTNQYILSNNHVLASVNAGSAGEAVSQPGLVDLSCSAPAADYVANLTRFVSIDFSRGATNTVDCAIAKVITGDVDPGGSILDVGQINSSFISAPAVGLAVKKSGRTTGLTTGSITGINATISVQYQLGCGSGKKATATYVNQLVFTNISSGGDSGSLIVEDVASCPRPVGLLFAGSSSTTIGNPIGSVLSALGVSFVHGSCPAPFGAQFSAVPEFATQHAIDVQNRATPEFMSLPNVVGTSVGKDENGSYIVLVYLENDDAGARGRIPTLLEDLPTRVVVSGKFEAY